MTRSLHFSDDFCEIAVYLENPADEEILKNGFTVTDGRI